MLWPLELPTFMVAIIAGTSVAIDLAALAAAAGPFTHSWLVGAVCCAGCGRQLATAALLGCVLLLRVLCRVAPVTCCLCQNPASWCSKRHQSSALLQQAMLALGHLYVHYLCLTWLERPAMTAGQESSLLCAASKLRQHC